LNYECNRKYNSSKIKQLRSCTGFGSALSLFQKLIDVQQTLIANPNPLKRNRSFNPGKTKKKSDISQLLFF
jgi:hypothetical protein